MLETLRISKSFPLPRRKPKKAPAESDPREQAGFFHAVREVSFSAQQGTILGVLGPNGAGKTTLMRMLSTAIQPSSGTAVMDGADIIKEPLEVRKKIGFLSGTTGLYGRLTAREMLLYYGELHGLRPAQLSERMEDLSKRLGMASFLDRRNDNLSTGMKQKVAIARTLLHDPSILIFDEPTTGLDVATAQAVLELIESCKAAHKTVLFSTHHMHEVERLCDAVIIISQGRCCFRGSVEKMRQQSGEHHLDQAFLKLIASPQGGESL